MTFPKPSMKTLRMLPIGGSTMMVVELGDQFDYQTELQHIWRRYLLITKFDVLCETPTVEQKPAGRNAN